MHVVAEQNDVSIFLGNPTGYRDGFGIGAVSLYGVK